MCTTATSPHATRARCPSAEVRMQPELHVLPEEPSPFASPAGSSSFAQTALRIGYSVIDIDGAVVTAAANESNSRESFALISPSTAGLFHPGFAFRAPGIRSWVVVRFRSSPKTACLPVSQRCNDVLTHECRLLLAMFVTIYYSVLTDACPRGAAGRPIDLACFPCPPGSKSSAWARIVSLTRP